MLPRVGSRSPVSSRNRVVFPVPFRPRMPQRSPGATVKETSENSFVAPKSTPTLANAIWVMGWLPGSQSQDLTACKQEGPGAVNLRLLWSRVAGCISHALNVAELAAWPYGPNQCRPSSAYRALVFAPKQTLIHAPCKRVREEACPAGLRIRLAVWIKQACTPRAIRSLQVSDSSRHLLE